MKTSLLVSATISQILKIFGVTRKSLIAFLLVTISCSIFAGQMLGGFGAPIYFTKYDQNKINSIKNVHGIDHILISYQSGLPQLQKLAQNIAQNLPGIEVILKPFNFKNNKITQYNLRSVVVVIYFTPGKG